MMWPLLAPVLKDYIGERTMDIFPILSDLFLERVKPSVSLPETIGSFIAARKLAGHPVVVHLQEGNGPMTGRQLM
jgi:hypothetical protein